MANKRIRTTPRYLTFTGTVGGTVYTVTGDGIVVLDTTADALVALGAGVGIATVVTDPGATPVDPGTTYATTGDVTATVAAGVAAKTDQVAVLDFTTKSDGAAPLTLDTGQALTSVFAATGRAAKIAGGKLVIDPAGLTAGGVADYAQSDLGAPVVRIGVEYTMPAGADDGNGAMCYAVFASIYAGGGSNVPKSWCHMVHVPGTGATGTAKWFVCDGIGHLFVVKQQTYTNPTADDATVWSGESVLDAAAGVARSWLPDETLMTLTDAEIAAVCTTLGYPVVKLADLAGSVIMAEHFATAGAATAKFARFTSMYGETSTSAPRRARSKTITPGRFARAMAALKALIPAPKVVTPYATGRTQLLTASAANVTDGTNNCTVAGTYGPTGVIEFEAEATVVFTGAETTLGRLAGPANTATEPVAKLLGLATGEASRAVPFKHTWKLTGGTPGATGTWTLQMSAATANSLASVAFGGAGAGYPPLVLKATPL